MDRCAKRNAGMEMWAREGEEAGREGWMDGGREGDNKMEEGVREHPSEVCAACP